MLTQVKIAKELGTDHTDLEKLSGRITDDVRKLIKENPEAAVLMRKIAADKNPNMVLKKLLKEVQKK